MLVIRRWHLIGLLFALFGLQPALVSAQSQDTVIYYHTDAIGSVRMITDANQQVIACYDYLPFGEPWPCSGNPEPRQFAGKERDAETTFDYFGGRYYGSGNGRFTIVDPVLDREWALGDPQVLNRYTYALNNPLRFIDPDGRFVVQGGYDDEDILANWAFRAWIRDLLSPFPRVASVIDVLLVPIAPVSTNEQTIALGSEIIGVGAMAFEARGIGQIHHIATNKAIKSGYTKVLERIFAKARLSLDNPVNKVFLEGHAGRHAPVYHQYVIDRLMNATRGLSGASYRQALESELRALRTELLANPGLVRGVGLK